MEELKGMPVCISVLNAMLTCRPLFPSIIWCAGDEDHARAEADPCRSAHPLQGARSSGCGRGAACSQCGCSGQHWGCRRLALPDWLDCGAEAEAAQQAWDQPQQAPARWPRWAHQWLSGGCRAEQQQQQLQHALSNALGSPARRRRLRGQPMAQRTRQRVAQHWAPATK